MKWKGAERLNGNFQNNDDAGSELFPTALFWNSSKGKLN